MTADTPQAVADFAKLLDAWADDVVAAETPPYNYKPMVATRQRLLAAYADALAAGTTVSEISASTISETPPEADTGEAVAWRCEIKHGPAGEENYAWVYCGKEMVCTAKTHHAKAIVAALARPQGTEAGLVEAVIAAAVDLYDNRLGWSDGRKPYAPPEFWDALGAALASLRLTQGGGK